MDMTTTENNWLKQFTAKTRAVYEDALKLRKKDYDGWVPPDVMEIRRLKEKQAEHESALVAIKRGIMSIAGAFDKKK